jgi:hypothetical protein
MTVDVMIVGTEPPCPRCDQLEVLVANAAPVNVTVELRHCAFDSPEAKQLGRQLDRKIGTAKHVAHAAGIAVDWNAVYGLIERTKSSFPPDCRPADVWTQELDSLLEPCQKAADSQQYLMTPILIVNGQLVHHGSVPSKQEIAAWLTI